MLHCHRPAPAAHGEVPAGVDEAGAGGRKHVGGAFDGVAFRDPAEVDPRAGLELDPVSVDRDAAAARAGHRVVTVRVDLFERAVVAGGDERVVDGRVEASVRRLARLEREFERRG